VHPCATYCGGRMKQKQISLYEASYYGYLYDMTFEEFDSLILSNNVRVEYD